MKKIAWRATATRFLLAIFLVSSLLLVSAQRVNAQITCTSDHWGECGPAAGCLNGYICAPSAGNPPCVINPQCGATDPAKDPTVPIVCGAAGTDFAYGPAGGCSAGYYCSHAQGNTCVYSPANDQGAGACPAATCIDGCFSIGQCINNKTCIITNNSLAPTGLSCNIQAPGQSDATPPLNIFDGPTAANFAQLNPLVIFNSPFAELFRSPAGIINRALLFIFPLAGLILFVMLLWGGFEMITGATSKKATEQGRQRISSALIGFGLLYISFWIIQIVEYIFNIAIL